MSGVLPTTSSYWLARDSRPSRPPVGADGAYDAVVIGGGLTGLTTAYYGDLPPGGTIVLVAAAFFVLASGARAVLRGA